MFLIAEVGDYIIKAGFNIGFVFRIIMHNV
jgi:hypothetical protein